MSGGNQGYLTARSEDYHIDSDGEVSYCLWIRQIINPQMPQRRHLQGLTLVAEWYIKEGLVDNLKHGSIASHIGPRLKSQPGCKSFFSLIFVQIHANEFIQLLYKLCTTNSYGTWYDVCTNSYIFYVIFFTNCIVPIQGRFKILLSLDKILSWTYSQLAVLAPRSGLF